jgi:hypothetical protein
LGLARTKKLKAVKYWITKKLREDSPCDVVERKDALIAALIREMSLAAGEKSTDSKLYYTEAFNASDYKNWIKKVTNYLDSRKGKAGVPLSYVIRPAEANPDNATDEYTRTLWAALFETPQYVEDNREVYHLYKDLVTKTDGATWFEKVTDAMDVLPICCCVNIMLERRTICVALHPQMQSLRHYSGIVRLRSRLRSISLG